VTTWFRKWKLNLNPKKSAAKIFSLKRYKDPQTIYIDNQPIKWNNKDVKYLGVFLDEKLTWNIHTNKKTHSKLCKIEHTLSLSLL